VLPSIKIDNAKSALFHCQHTQPYPHSLYCETLDNGEIVSPGNTKGGSIDLLFDWFGLVCFHTADSKPVKQVVNGTVILPPLVFPG